MNKLTGQPGRIVKYFNFIKSKIQVLIMSLMLSYMQYVVLTIHEIGTKYDLL